MGICVKNVVARLWRLHKFQSLEGLQIDGFIAGGKDFFYVQVIEKMFETYGAYLKCFFFAEDLQFIAETLFVTFLACLIYWLEKNHPVTKSVLTLLHC